MEMSADRGVSSGTLGGVWGAVGILLATFLSVCDAVYFTQEQPVLCLHSSSVVGTMAGSVFAYTSAGDLCGNQTIKYDVTDNSTFTVNSTGAILSTRNFKANESGIFQVNISATCESTDLKVKSTYLTVSIRIITPSTADITNHVISTREARDICFSNVPKSLTIEENVQDAMIAHLSTCTQWNGVTLEYSVVKPKSKFTIDSATSNVRLLKALDRERLDEVMPNKSINITGIQPLRVKCDVKKAGVIQTTQTGRINVMVLDVDDNPPTFMYHNHTQHLTKSIDVETIGNMSSKISEIVLDIDRWTKDLHQLRVLDDHLHVCNAKLDCPNAELGKSICRVLIQLENLSSIQGTLYHCHVAIIDPTLVPSSTVNNSAVLTVILHKSLTQLPRVQPLTSPLTITFYRNATKHARLLRIPENLRGPKTSFRLRNAIFNVTKDGIVYLYNVEKLSSALDDSMALNVERLDGVANVNIIVNLHGEPRNQHDCDYGCSRHKTAASCTGSCGVGLTNGGCVMRGSDSDRGMSTSYSTCTHNIATCPDQVCDELEQRNHMLCPQDCTTELNGEGHLNSKVDPPRGIVFAKSPCWCEIDFGISCTCLSLPNKRTMPKPKPSTAVSPTETLTRPRYTTMSTVRVHQNKTEEDNVTAVLTQTSTLSCDNACGIAIGLGLGAFVAIAFSLFMLWFTKKRNDRRKNTLKQVGSVVSMSAVPSDYMEDREHRLSYSSPQWSPKGPIYNWASSVQLENRRWEIPRENITLDKTLGEGEFGLVVKAKVVGLDGDNSSKYVAVKMLKHCSTQLEEQDLWSEFTLLKDVSHPNVIRLLGACTEDGPFYVIVEYCEHGCLLKYLRRSRLEENGYINSQIRCTTLNAREQTDPTMQGDLLSLRDLLSFAWQIAKGMTYLSAIKLVHRDLAARNVLVASGKLLKISDFGLTRDVYEADTYLKKSRGRIPVKWLAPESLYSQIYTTQSDVWSYGIVLWEIVTLGAPPYPGIPPERLFNLLMGGYRMDRPENCSDEMYAVMQKCWKLDRAERPSFASLALIFDRILQEKTGYLDLTQIGSAAPDPYSKCFDKDVQDTKYEDAGSCDAESDATIETVDGSGDTRTVVTVCNETYLSPVSVQTQELSDTSAPLLNCDNQLADTNKTRHPSRDYTNESDSPVFKKVISENNSGQSPAKHGSKKNVIFPSENLSLLVDNGTAKFVNVNEDLGQTTV